MRSEGAGRTDEKAALKAARRLLAKSGKLLQIPAAKAPLWDLGQLEGNEKIISGATIAAAVSLALAGAATPTPAAAHYVAGKAHNHCKTQKSHCKVKVHCRTHKAPCKGMSSCKRK